MYMAVFNKTYKGCKEFRKELGTKEALIEWIKKRNEQGAGIWNVSIWKVDYILVDSCPDIYGK